MHQRAIAEISQFVESLENSSSAAYDPERGITWAKVLQKLEGETALLTKMIDEVRSIPAAPAAPSKHEEDCDNNNDDALSIKAGRAPRGEQRRSERANGVARRHEDAKGEAATEWGPPASSSSSPYDPISRHSPGASDADAAASPVPHLPAWVSRAQLPKRPQPAAPGAAAARNPAQQSPPRPGLSPRVPRNGNGPSGGVGGPKELGAAPFGHGRNHSQQNAAPGPNLSPPRIGKSNDVSSVEGVKPTVPPRRSRPNFGAPTAAGGAAASPRLEPSPPQLSTRVAPAAAAPRPNNKAAVPVQQPPAKPSSDARPGGGIGGRNGWNNGGGVKRGQAGNGGGGGRGGRGNSASNNRGARGGGGGGGGNGSGSGAGGGSSNDISKVKYSVYCAQEGIPDVPLVESIERDILGQGASVGWDDIADLGEAKELLQVRMFTNRH